MPVRTSHVDSTFSAAHQIARKVDDDWFDPTLHTDTQLFVDPFLMFDEKTGPWSTIHDRLIEFFNEALAHVAASNRKTSSPHWTTAAKMFSFPEPPQFCLGYGESSIWGSGTSKKLGIGMLQASVSAIDAGIKSIDSLSDLLLFGEYFGADRLSDMICNITKDLFVDYTEEVAGRYELSQRREIALPHVAFDYTNSRWRKRVVSLPSNPLWTTDPGVLLVPRRFLDELPQMESGAFWEWVYDNYNAQLRHELGITIATNLDRKRIIATAKSRPRLARKFGATYVAEKRQNPPKPYDLDTDPRFRRRGFDLAEAFALTAKVEAPSSPQEFCAFVSELVEDFKWMIESRGMWKQMWQGAVPQNERRAQLMFHAAVLLLCKRLDIDVTPEADAGSGPVDFKFSHGWNRRSLVELKLAKSTSYWDNLERQTPAYLAAEGIACGTFLVIQHEDLHCTSTFMETTRRTVARVAKATSHDYKVVFVDARQKTSASKLKRE